MIIVIENYAWFNFHKSKVSEVVTHFIKLSVNNNNKNINFFWFGFAFLELNVTLDIKRYFIAAMVCYCGNC